MNLLVALSLIAGLLAVDHRAGWQSLVAQPVFAGLLIGVVIGELPSALIVGLVLQLIYLSILPMRGTKVPDHIAAGVVGAGTAALLMRHTGDPRFAFVSAVGVFVGLLAGELGARLTAPLFGLQNRLLGGLDFGPRSTRRTIAWKISWVHAVSIGYIFVVEALLVFLLGSAGYFAGERFTRLVDGPLLDGAVHWRALVPAIGVASLIHLFWQHHLRRVLIACAILVVILLWLM